MTTKFSLNNTGRIFFAISIAGLGITHFIFQDFMTGRAPAWPEHIPGGALWANLSGLFFISTSIAVVIGKKARLFLVLSALIIFLLAFLRQLPELTGVAFLSPIWTDIGKALVLCGRALVYTSLFSGISDKRLSPLLARF